MNPFFWYNIILFYCPDYLLSEVWTFFLSDFFFIFDWIWMSSSNTYTNTPTSFTEEGYILSIELFPVVWLSISQYKANGLETRTENIFCLLRFDRGWGGGVWWDDNKCTESQNTINKSTHNQRLSPGWTHLPSRLANHMGIITTAGVGIRENITR